MTPSAQDREPFSCGSRGTDVSSLGSGEEAAVSKAQGIGGREWQGTWF